MSRFICFPRYSFYIGVLILVMLSFFICNVYGFIFLLLMRLYMIVVPCTFYRTLIFIQLINVIFTYIYTTNQCSILDLHY